MQICSECKILKTDNLCISYKVTHVCIKWCESKGSRKERNCAHLKCYQKKKNNEIIVINGCSEKNKLIALDEPSDWENGSSFINIGYNNVISKQNSIAVKVPKNKLLKDPLSNLSKS